MMAHLLKLVVIAVIAVWPAVSGCGEGPGDEHEDISHAGADAHGDHKHVTEHADHEADAEADAHDDRGHGDDHAGHETHGDGEQALVLSPEAMRLAGIRVKTAQLHSLARTIELPGEIGFNQDRLAHVTPRYAGVAREVHGYLGAHVKEGDLLAVIESNESLSKYSVKAPISGWIIEKDITAGEFVAEDHDMFLIADLSTVWADCEVYAKDMPYVKQGARVTISAVDGGNSVEAILSYVAPVYSGDTRTALARAVLVNDGDLWRPGTFIRATVPVELEDLRLAVEKAAVQVLGEEHVVFVPGEEEGEFESVPVRTGTSNAHAIEILSGLSPGDAYVAEGAFELKATMVTANLDPHAGHGH